MNNLVFCCFFGVSLSLSILHSINMVGCSFCVRFSALLFLVKLWRSNSEWMQNPKPIRTLQRAEDLLATIRHWPFSWYGLPASRSGPGSLHSSSAFTIHLYFRCEQQRTSEKRHLSHIPCAQVRREKEPVVVQGPEEHVHRAWPIYC